jgi:iron uptake system EfeUOB component EfeO/EfeM
MRKVVKSKAITVAKQKETIDEGSGSRRSRSWQRMEGKSKQEREVGATCVAKKVREVGAT